MSPSCSAVKPGFLKGLMRLIACLIFSFLSGGCQCFNFRAFLIFLSTVSASISAKCRDSQFVHVWAWGALRMDYLGSFLGCASLLNARPFSYWLFRLCRIHRIPYRSLYMPHTSVGKYSCLQIKQSNYSQWLTLVTTRRCEQASRRCMRSTQLTTPPLFWCPNQKSPLWKA